MANRESTCRQCGAPIRWCTVQGKRIPLDTRVPVYHREWDPDGQTGYYYPDGILATGERTAWAPHGPVCRGSR